MVVYVSHLLHCMTFSIIPSGSDVFPDVSKQFHDLINEGAFSSSDTITPNGKSTKIHLKAALNLRGLVKGSERARWFKNGNELRTGRIFTLTLNSGISQAILQQNRDATPADSGVYTLEVTAMLFGTSQLVAETTSMTVSVDGKRCRHS